MLVKSNIRWQNGASMSTCIRQVAHGRGGIGLLEGAWLEVQSVVISI